MKPKVFSFVALLGLLASLGAAQVAVEVGQQAPDFELVDAAGTAHKLSDYRGEKVVVLEFFRSGDW
jgi:hypothetical protein